MGMTTPRDNLRNVLARVMETIPDILPSVKAKGRDLLEPGVERKTEFEDKLNRIIQAHFKRQQQKITDRLATFMPGRKAVGDLIDYGDLAIDDEFQRDLVLLLTEAVQDGLILYSEGSAIGIDYTLVNTGAAKWAREYAGTLIKEIDTSTLASVRQTIGTFVETPGMTVRDVINRLPYGETRAMSIATTEITRSYASANQLAGEQLKKDFPGVRVVKTWYTNNDDRVCEICGPLHTKEVDIDQAFEGGIDKPPAHPRCRCWLQTRTRI
jgi:hypothetical protein